MGVVACSPNGLAGRPASGFCSGDVEGEAHTAVSFDIAEVAKDFSSVSEREDSTDEGSGNPITLSKLFKAFSVCTRDCFAFLLVEDFDRVELKDMVE